MNDAEKALRKCTYGPPLQAVRILDSWKDGQRQKFRDAYKAGDWISVYRLCMNGSMTPPSARVLIHLLDATQTENKEN